MLSLLNLENVYFSRREMVATNNAVRQGIFSYPDYISLHTNTISKTSVNLHIPEYFTLAYKARPTCGPQVVLFIP